MTHNDRLAKPLFAGSEPKDMLAAEPTRDADCGELAILPRDYRLSRSGSKD